jgi:hypothetical protein
MTLTSKLKHHNLEKKAEDESKRQTELDEYRRRAMEQWFEDASCTGGSLAEQQETNNDTK